jgi:hypothetical protein
MNPIEAMQICVRVAELASFTQTAESIGRATSATARQGLHDLAGIGDARQVDRVAIRMAWRV